MKIKNNNKVVIYQAKSGAIELRGDFSRETVWATQADIAKVFGVNVRTVSEHLVNIFKSKELNKTSVVRNFRTTAKDGKIYDTQFYNLDAIISVGYRVNSKTATEFRKWATKTLRNYVVDGFAINKNRVAKNYEKFLTTVENIKSILPAGITINNENIIDLISLFADTWLSLDAYDKEITSKNKLTKKRIEITAEKISENLLRLKQNLLDKGEASDIFGVERNKGDVVGIFGNIMQTFGGKELYPTIEEKAAHLLYFMVKNHPFIDGNKRSGAFAFVWFLQQAKLLNIRKITPSALTALTILVAESNPNHKNKVIKLILNLISKK
jgi:prophage maintenance system killer protein